MNTIKVNKDSWHYRVVNVYAQKSCHDISICSYVKHLFAGLFSILMLIIIVSILCVPLIHFIAWALAGGEFSTWNQLTDGQEFLVGFGIIESCVILLLLFLWARVETSSWWQKQKEHPSEKRSFIMQAVDSLVDKYCIKVEVVDNNTNGNKEMV